MQIDEFPQHLQWLNTPRPLRLHDDLKGHVVLLHFWAHTCIHCLNTLPDLSQIRKKFANQTFVIIGVHVGKYDSDERAIRAAVTQNNIQHPVVIDAQRELWNTFAVNSWPTMVLLGADGAIIGAVSGEGHQLLLEATIGRALDAGARAGILAPVPIDLRTQIITVPPTGLAFPTKIVTDTKRRRLIVVDSQHHRIVVAGWPDHNGKAPIQRIIGTPHAGMQDGEIATAEFRAPQGATLTGGRDGADILWVADTGNHCVRRIDLAAGRVTTALGSGAREFDNEAGKSGQLQLLNSPRDVAVLGNRLYVSQAGQHQIFAMNLMTAMAEVACGTAREDWRDGDSNRAYLAQPSGLALDRQHQLLYFADAENSAVRTFDLRSKKVRTIVGSGMFDFGDVDGPLNEARLQHCMGLVLTADGSHIVVADTGNHKIKIIDLQTSRISTICGAHGELFEPRSVALSEAETVTGDIFATDTGNHRILHRTAPECEWNEITFDGL